MPKNSRRNFLKAAAPAAMLATPALAQQGASQPLPPVKKVHRNAAAAKKPQTGVPIFNQAVSYGNLLFIAGLGAGAGFEGDIKAHTKHALDRLEEALKNAGSSMEKALKVTVYLADLKDYQGMNEVYQGRFGAEPPVRTTVSITGIPDHTLVEIDCIAYI